MDKGIGGLCIYCGGLVGNGKKYKNFPKSVIYLERSEYTIYVTGNTDKEKNTPS